MSTERSDLAMCPKPSVVSQLHERRESEFREMRYFQQEGWR